MRLLDEGFITLVGLGVLYCFCEYIDDKDLFDKKTQIISSSSLNSLSVDSVKKIVASELGLGNEETSNLVCDIEFNNIINIYNARCYSDGTLYEYNISGDTNNIIVSDSYIVNGDSSNIVTDDLINSVGSSYIGDDKALNIALTDRNITTITYSFVEFDYDDGIAYYEIEFKVNIVEYEYKINALTGSISEFDIDYD